MKPYYLGGNHVKEKIYLLEEAFNCDFETPIGFYDNERQINVVLIDGKKHPLISFEMGLGTQSKTKAAPGDDDPDPEDMRCY
jgi:hypothetical protein